MQHDFNKLSQLLDAINSKLSTGEIYRLNRTLAVAIRRSQSDRIRRQENPDGSKYEGRSRAALRKRRANRRNQPMFRKLRTARYLRFRVTPDEIQVGYFGSGGVSNIANIHHKGLVDKINNISFVMPERRLLGLTKNDEDELLDAIMIYFQDVYKDA